KEIKITRYSEIGNEVQLTYTRPMQGYDPMATAAWYAALDKPFFAPPSWLFGPVWSVLYVGIALTFGFVFWQTLRRRWPPAAALPFGINLLCNFLFTPLQFGLRSNGLALLDILLVLGTLVWCMVSVWPRARWVTLAQIPYLLWVSFATLLQ